MGQYTDEQLLIALKDFALRLGRTPIKEEMLSKNKVPGKSTYIRRFGSWNNALNLVNLPTNHTIKVLHKMFTM